MIRPSLTFMSGCPFGTRHELPDRIGHLEPSAAGTLGVQGITLLAVRPDGYVGVQTDRDHLSATERYQTLVRTGHA
jgi:hypothetical protein